MSKSASKLLAVKAPKPPAKKPRTKKAAKPLKPETSLRPARALAPPSPSQPLHDLIIAQLEDAKAEDVVSLSLEGKSTLADTMIVASGRSNRHVAAIAEQLVEKLKEKGYRDMRVEGMEQADWVVVDTSDVIVHLFRPEVRSFYNIERLWSEHSPRETHTG